ncbi:hypothetical protein DICVIV_09623 [Dictyocaulus viviparus]|uniref:Dynein associated protein domain-containing protein n=1 Tax=Dictyocaulus viviparus TaxID=29172 RepID=A0A0D8XKL2_DICVI|nr:hypothetical protein DICVIV_09623 [Dictyocaulus viviparus]
MRAKEEENHRDELVTTIMKFRKKVGEQNEEIQELKDQSIERQISVIELESARMQMGYLKQFLPDNFNKAGGDNDALVLSVLFPRLSAKAKLLSKLVAERFPEVPGGTRREHVTKSHKAEQWANSARISYVMNALVAVCGQFESALVNISLEELSRLAQLQPEMSAQEKVIDSYFELLRQNRLDAETSLENMDKVVVYFQNVLSVNISMDCYDSSAWLKNICQQLSSGIVWCQVNNQRISFFLMPGSNDCDVSKMVNAISAELVECERLVIRAGKRIPADSRIKLTPQINDDIQSAIHHLARLALILHETCGIASVQINMNPELEGFESTRLKEMIHGEVEKINGSITLEKTYEPIGSGTLKENLTKIFTSLDDGSLDVNAKSENFPPVLERAHLRKQAAAEAEGLRWQLERKDMEILELKKTIKSRLDDISNYKLRLNMAEARIESTGKQDNVKMQHLEAKIEQLITDNKKKQMQVFAYLYIVNLLNIVFYFVKLIVALNLLMIMIFSEFDETMDALQKELKESERENSELKQMAKNFSRKTLLENIQRIESRAAAPQVQAASVGIILGREESAVLEQQLADSRDAFGRATLEIVQLRAQLALARSHSAVMRLPDLVCGPETLRTKENDTVLEMISKEVEQLKREELKYMVFVPNPSRSRHMQEQDRIRFENERNAYNYKVSALRNRLNHYWNETCPGQSIPNLFGINSQKKTPRVHGIRYGSQAFTDICNKWGVKV